MYYPRKTKTSLVWYYVSYEMNDFETGEKHFFKTAIAIILKQSSTCSKSRRGGGGTLPMFGYRGAAEGLKS